MSRRLPHVPHSHPWASCGRHNRYHDGGCGRNWHNRRHLCNRPGHDDDACGNDDPSDAAMACPLCGPFYQPHGLRKLSLPRAAGRRTSLTVKLTKKILKPVEGRLMKFVFDLTPIRYNFQRNDILAALFVLIILGGLLVAATGWVKVNNGFGPDWHCAQPGSGDPVCTKKSTPRPS